MKTKNNWLFESVAALALATAGFATVNTVFSANTQPDIVQAAAPTTVGTVISGDQPLYNGFGDAASFSKTLAQGSTWKVFSAMIDVHGQQWFNLGGNQWIKDQAMSLAKYNYINVSKERTIATVNSATPLYQGYGNGAPVVKTLPAGSAWVVLATQQKDNNTWYEVGNNQWIAAKNVVQEQSQTNNTATTTPSQTNNNTAQAAQSELFQLVNQYRKVNGFSTLNNNILLQAASQVRAQQEVDAANKANDITVVDHKLPNGQPFYDEDHLLAYGPSALGENLLVANGASADQIAQNAFNEWKNSPAHNANMLDKRWTDSGLTVMQLNNGQWFAIQDFGVQ